MPFEVYKHVSPDQVEHIRSVVNRVCTAEGLKLEARRPASMEIYDLYLGNMEGIMGQASFHADIEKLDLTPHLWPSLWASPQIIIAVRREAKISSNQIQAV